MRSITLGVFLMLEVRGQQSCGRACEKGSHRFGGGGASRSRPESCSTVKGWWVNTENQARGKVAKDALCPDCGRVLTSLRGHSLGSPVSWRSGGPVLTRVLGTRNPPSWGSGRALGAAHSRSASLLSRVCGRIRLLAGLGWALGEPLRKERAHTCSEYTRSSVLDLQGALPAVLRLKPSL